MIRIAIFYHVFQNFFRIFISGHFKNVQKPIPFLTLGKVLLLKKCLKKIDKNPKHLCIGNKNMINMLFLEKYIIYFSKLLKAL
jgi:hypothetical protein